MHYYRHHIGDFNKATRHLNRLERSIYRDLIDLYMDTEHVLPVGIEWLSKKILAPSNDERSVVESILNEFFEKKDEGWFNERCEAELAWYRDYHGQRSKAGKASGKARAKKPSADARSSTDVQHSFNGRSTNQYPLTSNQEPITKEIPLSPNPADSETAPQVAELYTPPFLKFWAAYPNKYGKAKAFQIFQKLKLAHRLDEILSALEWQTKMSEWTKNGGQYVPMAAKYLTDRLWLDERPAKKVRGLVL